jgi:RHS repeat-associated protein
MNREEFFPYGETSFGSFGRKRYRFAGRERDEESGLSIHGVRYYYASLSRWISTDPIGPVDGANLYFFSKDSPISSVDRSGLQTPQESAGVESETSNSQPSNDARDTDNILGPLRKFFGFAGADQKENNALASDDGVGGLYEAKGERAKGLTGAGEILHTTGELINAVVPGPHAEPDALTMKIIDAISEGVNSIKNAGKRFISSIVEGGENAKNSIAQLLRNESKEIGAATRSGTIPGGIFNDENSLDNCTKTVSSALASMNSEEIITASKFDNEMNDGLMAVSNSYIERKAGVELGAGEFIIGDESRTLKNLDDGFYVVYSGLESRGSVRANVSDHVLLGAIYTDVNGFKAIQLFDPQLIPEQGMSVSPYGKFKVYPILGFKEK